jgi:dipeptidyl aminopeptidase/acylaminoacyl peptidase
MLALASSVAVWAAAGLSAQPGLPASARYLTPPQAIVDILDARPLPTAVLSPGRDVLALYEKASMPTIAELAEPMLRLAGTRIDPRTNALHREGDSIGLVLKSLADGSDRRVALPAGRRVETFGFSPDGTSIALGVVEPAAVGLWIVDVKTARARAVPGAARLNLVLSPTCDWLDDGSGLVCITVPASRGQAPAAPAVPDGPNVQESSGRTAPGRTFPDVLTSARDEALFEHYATGQVVLVDAKTGGVTPVGAPGLIADAAPSTDGRYLHVVRIKRPFSRTRPWSSFPKELEVWSRRGELARTIASVPMADTVPITGVMTGPRQVTWDPTRPARLVWAEALDGGDLKNVVPHRDRLMTLEAPFSGEPREWLKTEHRFSGMRWTDARVALVSEFQRAQRQTRTWLVDRDDAAPRKLWDRPAEDAYGHPGTPVSRPGRRTILQDGPAIYLAGDGASAQGARPFVDRLDLTTLRTERLFRSDETSYEQAVAMVSDDGSRVLTRRESRTSPPNYVLRTRTAGGAYDARAVTAFADPAPQLRGVETRLVRYTRPDGVELSATLHLPPGYKAGTRLPVLMWAYPREFTSAAAASQVTTSPNRFTTINGASHLLLLTQGYAIFDNPAMPIVGVGETANDTYVEQLVASAKAAVDKVVELGVGDSDRIGIGGHSYGAFMTANLLAHSDLFKMGIARSGAYNRSLTPFGFQAETRTFWEVPELYARMSPFWHAHKVNEPILLIHGEMDNNQGTFPMQSERFFAALQGHGATVRYVTLPYESHGYAARESVLHTIAEMVNWADKYLKAPAARPTTTSSR